MLKFIFFIHIIISVTFSFTDDGVTLYVEKVERPVSYKSITNKF